jgi:hypothetical protein
MQDKCIISFCWIFLPRISQIPQISIRFSDCFVIAQIQLLLKFVKICAILGLSFYDAFDMNHASQKSKTPVPVKRHRGFIYIKSVFYLSITFFSTDFPFSRTTFTTITCWLAIMLPLNLVALTFALFSSSLPSIS